MKRSFLAAAAVALIAPAGAYGQACLGVPTGPGNFALMGEVGFPEDAKQYTLTGVADLTGPLSLSASVGQVRFNDADESVTEFGGRAAWETRITPRISACPVIGATYSSFDMDFLGVTFEASQLLVPVGVGFGTTVATSVADVNLFAVPALLWARASFEGSFEGETESETETDTAFGATLGARARFGSLFGGASVDFNTFDESDTVFRLGVGFIIGR